MTFSTSPSAASEASAGHPSAAASSTNFVQEEGSQGFYLGTTRYASLAEAASRLRVPRPVLKRLVQVEGLSGAKLLEAVFRWKRGEAAIPSSVSSGSSSRKGRGTAITVNGVTYPSLTAACAGVGIPAGAMNYRVHVLGWTPEEALATPIGQRREGRPAKGEAPRGPVPVCVEGQTFKSIAAAARHYGKSPTRVQARLHYGWSLEMALTDATNLSIGEMFRQPVEYMGERYPSVFKACKALAVPYAPVLSQMSFGKPFDVALALVAETLRIKPTTAAAKRKVRADKGMPRKKKGAV